MEAFQEIDQLAVFKPITKWATRIYVHGRSDVICGPALVVETRAELEEPDEEG